ncbi:MAG: 3-hydroxyisobutyrate dehydrogenase [Candidatus Eremiobacteraeota bacterium]|nr:3-hydroxyisobutyrate dehydrogenase [Candidatus Eremiobacteraeota bacterium]
MNETNAPRVAVLGLGAMGAAFARNAARAGLRVTGWSRAPERQAALANDQVQGAPTAVDAVRDADVVVSIVLDAEAVLSVMCDQDAFNAMKAGSTWLQMSTIGAEGTERAMRLAATRPEITFVDAPVSGSKYVADEGKVVVLASGDRARTTVAVQRFFDAIAGQVHWLGEAGQGTQIGLLYNAWIAIQTENIAEVAMLAQALGIELQRFVELVSGDSLVPPWALEKLTKIVENRTSEIEVPLRLVKKNLLLALAAAGSARPRLPILNQLAITWAESLHGFDDADISALYLALQRR